MHLISRKLIPLVFGLILGLSAVNQEARAAHPLVMYACMLIFPDPTDVWTDPLFFPTQLGDAQPKPYDKVTPVAASVMPFFESFGIEADDMTWSKRDLLNLKMLRIADLENKLATKGSTADTGLEAFAILAMMQEKELLMADTDILRAEIREIYDASAEYAARQIEGLLWRIKHHDEAEYLKAQIALIELQLKAAESRLNAREEMYRINQQASTSTSAPGSSDVDTADPSRFHEVFVP